MGEDSCSKGHEFKSWRRVLDGYFFTLICCKNCIVCLKRQKRKEKEARVGPFKKILKDLGGRNWNFFLVHFELETNLVSYQAAAASKTFFFKFGQNWFQTQRRSRRRCCYTIFLHQSLRLEIPVLDKGQNISLLNSVTRLGHFWRSWLQIYLQKSPNISQLFRRFVKGTFSV